MESVYSEFKIKKENVKKAFNAIKELMGRVDVLGSGASYRGGKEIRHYAFVATDDVLNSTDLDYSLMCWRWDSMFNEDGDLIGLDFLGEKYGDEKHLFTAIAEFVESDSYIEMIGEDHEKWRWIFKDGKLLEKKPRIIWETVDET